MTYIIDAGMGFDQMLRRVQEERNHKKSKNKIQKDQQPSPKKAFTAGDLYLEQQNVNTQSHLLEEFEELALNRDSSHQQEDQNQQQQQTPAF